MKTMTRVSQSLKDFIVESPLFLTCQIGKPQEQEKQQVQEVQLQKQM